MWYQLTTLYFDNRPTPGNLRAIQMAQTPRTRAENRCKTSGVAGECSSLELIDALFILCVETPFIQIRENEEVNGIRIGDNEIKLSAYPDDADFLTSDVSSLETIFQTCATFQLYSSLKLNLEKSEACWIGNRISSGERPINCRWVNIKCCAISTLGIREHTTKNFQKHLTMSLKFTRTEEAFLSSHNCLPW